MIVQKNLKIDFAQRGLCQQVFVVQGDCLSRSITFSLYENGTPWELPSGVTPALRYGKSDGTGGVYDTLPDGNAAWTAEGNEVGMLLAPQVMTVPGLVQCQLMLVKEDAILGSFSFHLIVEPDPAYDAVESKGYFNWSKVVGNLIMAPQAEVGQSIRVKAVDAQGNPTEWEAVDFTESAQNANLTTAQINALDGMFKVCSYNGDPSDAYTAFKAAFGISDSGGEEEPDEPVVPDEPDDPDATVYTIANSLTNCASNNSATSITEGSAYTATLTASDGYTLDGATISVVVNGVDVTDTAYSDGVITIQSVTGNVVITVAAVKESTDSGEVVMLASITGDGESWIDTEVFANSYDYRFEYGIKDGIGGKETTIFGADAWTFSNAYKAMYARISTNSGNYCGTIHKSYYMIGNANSSGAQEMNYWNNAANKYGFEVPAYYVMNQNGTTMYSDSEHTNSLISVTQVPATDEALFPPLTLYLFACNLSDGAHFVNNYANGQFTLYDFRIYEDSTNTLLHEFLPAKQGGKIGMYDTVTQKFHENQGTGTFSYEEVSA